MVIKPFVDKDNLNNKKRSSGGLFLIGPDFVWKYNTHTGHSSCDVIFKIFHFFFWKTSYFVLDRMKNLAQAL